MLSCFKASVAIESHSLVSERRLIISLGDSKFCLKLEFSLLLSLIASSWVSVPKIQNILGIHIWEKMLESKYLEKTPRIHPDSSAWV